MGTVRLATRGSPLALRQTEMVAELLRRAHPGLDVEPVVVRTAGDQDASAPLDQIGGQGVFVNEVEAAVADGRADAAVHSAKDMPSVMGDHLVLGAVPPRADPRDGLVGCTLAGLPAGRRSWRPGRPGAGPSWPACGPTSSSPSCGATWPGGWPSARTAEVSAVVVAVAAMERLGWLDRLSDVLDPMDVLPQAGQGAIAVQCRADDEAHARAARAPSTTSRATARCVAERAVLAALGGSCTVPVGAFAEEAARRRPAPARCCGCRGWWPAATGAR